MVANKHMKMQLQIQEGTSVNIAVVESVVTPSVPLRIHYAILPLRGLLWEAKASVVASSATVPHCHRHFLKEESFKQLRLSFFVM